MTATDTASHKVSSWNRQTYQRLKLGLSLGLRRQLFVAVCDDLSLRNRLASQLQAELGGTSAKIPVDGQGYPGLVSLNLNLSNPNPLAQIAQWLAQNQQSRNPHAIPAFQILGVERLTRQPPEAQRLFLRHLRAVERNLPRLESALLLWLPRPWSYTIQQSVPEFWQWHTGIFEFEGEPTPLPPVGASKPEASNTSLVPGEATSSFKEDLQRLLADDLAEIDLASIGEISQESPPTDKSEDYQANSDIRTDVTEGKSAAAINQGIPSDPTPTKPASSDADELVPHTPDTDVWGFDDTESKQPIENGLATPHIDLKLGDVAQESSDAHPVDELVTNHQSQIPNPELDEPNQEEQRSQPTASPVDSYLELGNYYRQVIEQGDASEENLGIAIQAYEQALQWIEESSPQVPDILNDIGNLYWMLSRCPSSADNTLSYLEQAIEAYQLALTKLTAEEAPQGYAMIQNNLGAAYGDTARYKDSAENLEQSIRAYEEALRYRHADSDPIKYASTQNNLGTAYWNLAQHQSPVQNLRAAITAYKEALFYYHNQSEPLNWAMIQNNLGTAYWNLAQYEQPETWLQLATVAYQEALKYRTPEVAPAACAATQNNLGTAYWHLADRYQHEPEQRVNYLQECIVAYERAIALTQELASNTPPIPINFDVVATRNNLGLAHYQLATEPQASLDKTSKSAHLEAALHQHVRACTSVAAQSDAYQTALSYIIKTIRTSYQEGGITGQNLALSKVPGQLLPEILPRL